jgi:hypothetical protein
MDDLIEADLNQAALSRATDLSHNARHRVVQTRRTLPGLWKLETGIVVYLFGLTTATLFTPLQARYSCPSGVATMFRTTPPPDGIVFVLKVSD